MLAKRRSSVLNRFSRHAPSGKSRSDARCGRTRSATRAVLARGVAESRSGDKPPSYSLEVSAEPLLQTVRYHPFFNLFTVQTFRPVQQKPLRNVGEHRCRIAPPPSHLSTLRPEHRNSSYRWRIWQADFVSETGILKDSTLSLSALSATWRFNLGRIRLLACGRNDANLEPPCLTTERRRSATTPTQPHSR